MAVGERDPHSGHMTTGHEWNGIKELNTPIPLTVWLFLIATVVFSIGYWILMPAWPTGTTYTRGLLGHDDKAIVSRRVDDAELARSAWMQRIADTDYAAIHADEALMTTVRDHGQRLFGDNCAACHGTDAGGISGFPNLTDRDWLWGGDPDTIAQTIRVGVNSHHPETRISQMMAFGEDGLLENDAVFAVADYVKSLSDPGWAKGRAASIAKGRAVYAENCTICHGENGRGDQTLGAPNLTDKAWLYGSDIGSIYAVVNEGRHGEMPSWEGRLTPAEIKLLTVYLLDKGQTHWGASTARGQAR